MTTNHPAHDPVSLVRLHHIREILSKAAAQSDGGNIGYAMADAVKVIDVAIAAFDAEPMAWRWFHLNQWHVTNDEERARDLAWDGVKVIPLYTAPPAQVVPENYVTAEHRRVIEMLLNVCGAAFELADDSCQQEVDGEECHVVPDDAFQKLSDALDEIENTLPTEDVDRPDVFLAWSAMPRAALKSILQAGNSPVIPDEVLSAIRKVARIRTDFDHFDGDRRGIADCLDEAEQELIVTINEHAAMLQGSQPVSKREQVRREHAEWSDKTFGDVGPVGPLKHLSKEALEAAAEPDDLSEWADMQFLLWDAQRRAGISDGEITAAMEEKLKVNMARQWPEPKDGEPRQHIQNDWQSCNHLLPIGELLKRLNEQTGEEWVSTTDLDYGKWVRCSDRMPAKRVNVLVSDAGGNKFICCHENGFWRDFRVGFSRYEIIHWMPLPAAPQQEAK